MDPDTEQKLGDLAQRAQKQRRRFHARLPKPIGPVLAQVIAKRGYAAQRGSAELAKAWATAAGPALAPHTRVAGLARGRLEVVVSNSAMMQEIHFHRPRLLEAFRRLAPDSRVASLRLKIGEV